MVSGPYLILFSTLWTSHRLCKEMSMWTTAQGQENLYPNKNKRQDQSWWTNINTCISPVYKGPNWWTVETGVMVAVPEEQQVAPDVWEVSPPGGKALVGEWWIGKAPKASAPECLLLLLRLYTFAAADIFLWSLAWCKWVWRNPHCL